VYFKRNNYSDISIRHIKSDIELPVFITYLVETIIYQAHEQYRNLG